MSHHPGCYITPVAWVPAGHPQYTGAHHGGRPVDSSSTAHTMTQKSLRHTHDSPRNLDQSSTNKHPEKEETHFKIPLDSWLKTPPIGRNTRYTHTRTGCFFGQYFFQRMVRIFGRGVSAKRNILRRLDWELLAENVVKSHENVRNNASGK